ncbi:collagen alpha-1(IV) chain-like [Uloborus diversus]|uniref:collagen alpha-1(IV) chain-like n=1 Tax=Uloborus diversus TaxID=327109 RepID=UPI002409E0C9|nr:collagen alpha-1(IV) chain-like [Uloborus diversus]
MLCKVFVTAAIFSAAVASVLPLPKHHAPQLYKFGYNIKDKHGDQYREEVGDGISGVKGSYGFSDARGVHRQVDYVADHAGFRAQVKTNEPGTANQDPAAVKMISSSPYAGPEAGLLGAGLVGAPAVFAAPGFVGVNGLGASGIAGVNALGASGISTVNGLGAPGIVGVNGLGAPEVAGFNGFGAPGIVGVNGLGAPGIAGVIGWGAPGIAGVNGLGAPGIAGVSRFGAEGIPEHHAPKPYKFGYNIKDKHGDQYREEVGDGVSGVKGSYGFSDARGVHRRVNYVADHAGFRAQVKTNEPGTANQDPAAVKIISSAPYAGLLGAPAILAAPGIIAANGLGLGYEGLQYNRLGNAGVGYGLNDALLRGVGYARYGF